MCSSSGISCLRLEDGSASKSRLRGQFDRALIGALSRSSVLLVNSPVLKARMSKFQCLRTLAAELNPRENRLFLANATMPTGHPKCRSRMSSKGAYTRAAHQAARLPASPPTRSPSASTANEPDIGNSTSGPKVAQLPMKVPEGAYNSNEEIADDPKPSALHDLAGQPSGDDADHQYDQETFARHVHLRLRSYVRPGGAAHMSAGPDEVTSASLRSPREFGQPAAF